MRIDAVGVIATRSDWFTAYVIKTIVQAPCEYRISSDWLKAWCKFGKPHYNLHRTPLNALFIRCLLLTDSIKFTAASRSVNKNRSLQKLARKSNSIKCCTMDAERASENVGVKQWRRLCSINLHRFVNLTPPLSP
jgi:hypothetical protein